MEIVIGVILLVGAFALGHNTADQEALNAQARLNNEQALEMAFLIVEMLER